MIGSWMLHIAVPVALALFAPPTSDGGVPGVAEVASPAPPAPDRPPRAPEPAPFGYVAGVLRVSAAPGKAAFLLPLARTDVEMMLVPGSVSTRIVQTFVNSSASALEAEYIFPLPADAAVTDMALRIGDRTVRSDIRERDEARDRYDAARRDGKRAALLEQERANLFTMSLANIQPGETVGVTLAYVETAAYEDGRYKVRFPMVAGERYCPELREADGRGGLRVAPVSDDAARVNPPRLPVGMEGDHRLNLTLDIFGLPDGAIDSTTHALRVGARDASGGVRVTLRDGPVFPDRIFEASIRLPAASEPRMDFVHSDADGKAYGLLTVHPPTPGGERPAPGPESRNPPEPSGSLPRDIVFLIDTSGSMSGESIGQAKAGLKRCLGMLSANDRFTVVRFANHYSSFSPLLRPATPERLSDAGAYVEGLAADGGTEMYAALAHAYGYFDGDERARMIIFLTDACVNDEERILALAGSAGRGVRLFTFGIGSASNDLLIRGLADASGGQARYIRSHEDIGIVVADLFRTLSHPVITDVRLTWEAPDGRRRDVTIYPAPCPDVFMGRPLVALVASDDGFAGTLVLEGRRAGGTIEARFPIPAGETGGHPARAFIGRLYARERIRHLEGAMRRARDGSETEGLRRAMIGTSLEHQVLCRYTARVAVDEVRPERRVAAMTKVRVPVCTPYGWVAPSRDAPLPRTASGDPARLLLGLLLLALAYAVRRRKLAKVPGVARR